MSQCVKKNKDIELNGCMVIGHVADVKLVTLNGVVTCDKQLALYFRAVIILTCLQHNYLHCQMLTESLFKYSLSLSH